MRYRLFVNLEALQFLTSSTPSLRRKLVSYLSKIEEFPESSSDYFEYDSKGRRVDISIGANIAIHYWIDFADRHVKVLRISKADS